MAKPVLNDNNIIMKALLYIERAGLLLIIFATLIAVAQELMLVFDKKIVELHDILLFFIYLEILTMVALYLTSGKLPVRYPIYIAIVAITRYIILTMKEMNATDIIWLSASILILTFAAIMLRIGSVKFPYDSKIH